MHHLHYGTVGHEDYRSDLVLWCYWCHKKHHGKDIGGICHYSPKPGQMLVDGEMNDMRNSVIEELARMELEERNCK